LPEKKQSDLDKPEHLDPSVEKKGSKLKNALFKSTIGSTIPLPYPRLSWEGMADHDSIQLPSLSLRVTEKIDPAIIIEPVRKQSTRGQGEKSLLEFLEEPSPRRETIKSYRHENGWLNRLITGDSLLVMRSLLENEGMTSQVQMIYFDPPYGIDYSSTFIPFANKGKTKSTGSAKAYKDTWELGIHSYLNHLWKRFLLARELLTDSGSIFVQISDDNVHLVRILMDEVFGNENFISEIRYQCRTTEFTKFIPTLTDNLLWYGKNKKKTRYHQLFYERPMEKIRKTFDYVELNDGTVRPLTKEERKGFKPLPDDSKLFKAAQLSQKASEQIEKVIQANRSVKIGQKLYYKRYASDFPLMKHSNHWTDTVWSTFAAGKVYAVQTHATTVARCTLMTTDPGDLVFDPTCGSGTTAFVAEKLGRRWITCDTSRFASTLAKLRLMTAVFDYYELANPEEGLTSGFKYKKVPHITLSTISKNKKPVEEVLYDKPFVKKSKARMTGPFTVETLHLPVVKILPGNEQFPSENKRVADSGDRSNHVKWCEELLRAGILIRSNEKIKFSRVDPLPASQWLHAEAEITGDNSQRVLISIGPEHAPIDQQQVELAINEAQRFGSTPDLIFFAAFQFSPRTSKLLDETNWAGVTLLKVQINTELLMEDLKQGASDDSFWLIGKPEVKLEKIDGGNDKGKYRIKVLGINYYNPGTRIMETSDINRIVTWMFDPDYNGSNLIPRQVFFPVNSIIDWSNLVKNLKTGIDEELVEVYKGTISLPFEVGDNRRIAVKIVDNRGIESLKVITVEQ
jgi:adenine-specific DNA-methyltransferase